jgi:hypothetical protein
MMERLSAARRTARAVFFGLGVLITLLTFAPFATDANFRGWLARTNWSSEEFKSLVGRLCFAAGFGILFVLAALSLKHARLLGLGVLTACNLGLIFAAILSGADGGGVVLVPPLCVSFVALFVEDFRIVVNLRSRLA